MNPCSPVLFLFQKKKASDESDKKERKKKGDESKRMEKQERTSKVSVTGAAPELAPAATDRPATPDLDVRARTTVESQPPMATEDATSPKLTEGRALNPPIATEGDVATVSHPDGATIPPEKGEATIPPSTGEAVTPPTAGEVGIPSDKGEITIPPRRETGDPPGTGETDKSPSAPTPPTPDVGPGEVSSQKSAPPTPKTSGIP
uniref:Uncharacterized protein n=1 Tax=Bracon brevicornis TaxID=1563983 RepID=A0A6V7INW0_9HYME